MNPKYPIYIISKGRAVSGTFNTAAALTRMNVPFHIVIEAQEYDAYAAEVDPKKILVLPFSNLGQGSIPARNWVWNHSIEDGAAKHWIMDDNIKSFCRLNRNLKTDAADGTIIRCVEDFTDRYANVMMSGMNYDYFAVASDEIPVYYLNTRVYSCILLNNQCRHRWRGKYNEDTDLSIRILKDGHCTLLLNAFLARKAPTGTMKGGNADEIYAGEERHKNMTQSLIDQHPDIVRGTWKFRKWHHQVDYSGFKQRLVRKPEVKLKGEINEYGMTRVQIL